jgi:predicted nuclease with RNAse H fold
MDSLREPVVGIDVGGRRKGFHAVALIEGRFRKQECFDEPKKVVDWCLSLEATVVAVDAPCAWAIKGSSRAVERDLNKRKIRCFYTPTKVLAEQNEKGFYGWVLNGQSLYDALKFSKYQLFDGNYREGRVCLETFPHAIVCALTKVGSAKPKKRKRLEALLKAGYNRDLEALTKIDFIDAALCAVAADCFRKKNFEPIGDRCEGFIVVPKSCTSSS